jgi:pSer/pThr/pTyr-binding forkhead associated (FHA) protein
MSFQLVPVNPGTAPIITLQRPVVLVGRHIDCDARIEHAKISRRHCCLAIAYDRIVLRDLGSRNGIRVNGRIVEEVRLQAGDEVAIGPLIFRFEGQGAQPASPSGVQSAGRPAPGVGPGPAATGTAAPQPAPGWVLDDSDLDLVPLDDI